MERAVFFSDSPSAFPDITELSDEVFLRLLSTQRYLPTVESEPTLSPERKVSEPYRLSIC